MNEAWTLSPECPRCGYDLRGAQPARADAGTDALPSRGRCSECGLDFAWIDVLDPARHNVSWLYEHAPRRRGRLPSPAWRRAYVTFLRTLWPPAFWHKVTVHTRVSRWRLLWWLPVVIAPLHIVWSLVNTFRRIGYFQAAAPGWNVVTNSQWEVFFVNAWLYPLLELRGSRVAGLSLHLREPSYTFLLPLGASVLVPLVLLLLTRTRATARVRPVHVLRAGVYGLGWIGWWFVAWVALTVAAAMAELFGVGLFSQFRGRFALPLPLTPRQLGGVALLIWVAWFATFWWWALTRGLQLPRAKLVWALVMIAAVLAGALATWFDDRLWHTIGRWLM